MYLDSVKQTLVISIESSFANYELGLGRFVDIFVSEDIVLAKSRQRKMFIKVRSNKEPLRQSLNAP